MQRKSSDPSKVEPASAIKITKFSCCYDIAMIRWSTCKSAKGEVALWCEDKFSFDKNFFFQTDRAISGTTEPNVGMFVLVGIHFTV